MAEKEIKEVKNETPKKPEKVKKNKPSIFSRMAAWLKSCKAEMKKIVWANWSSVWSNTVVVIVAVVVISAIIGLVDLLFGQGVTILGILL